MDLMYRSLHLIYTIIDAGFIINLNYFENSAFMVT